MAAYAKNYDVFISYRRKTGFPLAQVVFEKLRHAGYSVFLDTEELGSGPFDTRLSDIIDNCTDFILLLTPGDLDNCSDENDWIRREVSQAIAHQKNIIPLVDEEFVFPAVLPEPMENLPKYMRVDVNRKAFSLVVTRLSAFMRSRPHRARFRLAGIVLLLCCVLGGFLLWQNTRPFPHGQKQTQVAHAALANVGHNLGILNNQYQAIAKLFGEGEDYLRSPTQQRYESLLTQGKYTKDVLRVQASSATPLSEGLRKQIAETPVPLDDLDALYALPRLNYEQEDFTAFVAILGPLSGFSQATKLRYLDIIMEIHKLEAMVHYYNLCEFLTKFSPQSLERFKTSQLPLITMFPTDATLSTDLADIKRLQDTVWNKQQALYAELAALVGNLSAKTEQLETLIQQINYRGKDVDEARELLKETQNAKEAVLQRAREKFRPLPEDAPGTLWSKGLRFLRLGLIDEAIQSFAMYESKERNSDPLAQRFVASAVAFARQGRSLGHKGGMLVVGFEKAASDPVLRVGDIIVAVNKQPSPSIVPYSKLTDAHQGKEIPLTILRLAEDGTLHSAAVIRSWPRQRIKALNLREEED